jgi:AcrR family transcriptional regulator
MTVPTPASGPVEKVRDQQNPEEAETRRLLRQAAVDLFLSQGYDATTVAIAAAANVSPSTFFRPATDSPTLAPPRTRNDHRR